MSIKKLTFGAAQSKPVANPFAKADVLQEQPAPAAKPNPFAKLAQSVAASKPAAPTTGFKFGANKPVAPPVEQEVSLDMADLGNLEMDIEPEAKKPDATKYVHEGQLTEVGVAAVEQLQTMLADLQASFQTYDVANAQRRVLNFMRDKPFLKNHLLPEDIGLMVRALRQSYGIVVTTKAENKKKTSARKSRVSDIAAELSDIDLGDLT